MIRATLDTNVLAPGFASLDDPRSTAGAIVRHWRSGRFELVVSPAILTELARTFAKPYFSSRRSRAQIDAALALLGTETTVIVSSVAVSGVATHPEDELVLAAAASAGCPLGDRLSGDRRQTIAAAWQLPGRQDRLSPRIPRVA